MKIYFNKSSKNSKNDVLESQEYDLLERLQILARDKINAEGSAVNDGSLYSADATPESKERQFYVNEVNDLKDRYMSEFD